MGNQSAAKMPQGVWLVIFIIVLTTFVMMVNETSLSVALPVLMKDFGIAASVAQWFVTGVMLTMAIILPTTGWLLDRFSTRKVYLSAVTMFLVGTLIAAFAPNFLVMLLARVVQAVGTAIMLPLQITVAMTVVPAHIRGTVMGIIAVVMAVGPALGPTYAGLVMEHFDWHMIFLALVPFVVLVLVLGAWKLKNVGEYKDTGLDALSVVLSAFAFGGIVYGLSSIGTISAGAEGAVLAIVVGVVGISALVAFIIRQRRLGDSALLNLEPLRSRSYVLPVAALLLLQATLLGVVTTMPLYMQGALLLTPLLAGLASLPGGLLETVASPIGGWLYDRIGPKPLAIPGIVAMIAAFLWMSRVNLETTVWVIGAQFAVMLVGLAFTFTPLMTSALSSVSQELYSHGSAIFNTLVQLASAAGTAILIAVYSAISMSGGQSPQAMTDGANTAFLIAVGLGIAALICVLCMPRRKRGVEVITVKESA